MNIKQWIINKFKFTNIQEVTLEPRCPVRTPIKEFLEKHKISHELIIDDVTGVETYMVDLIGSNITQKEVEELTILLKENEDI